MNAQPSPEEIQSAAQWARSQLPRNDLIEFAQTIDPRVAQEYGAVHLRKMANRLEAVERGEVKRLFITCPPRHWKSSLAAEKFPLFWLGRNPRDAVTVVSHSVSLAEQFSRNVRDNVLHNEAFRALFPVEMNPGRAGVHDWALSTAVRSSLRAVGVRGAITGHGSNLIVIDDPVADAMEASSPAQREMVGTWYKETLRTRLEPGGAIVLIMSRWNVDDLAGRIMKASAEKDGEPWETFHLPAVSESGEALWPARWPLPELDKLKLAIGSRAWAAAYMGTPRPEDGAILDAGKLVMCNAEDVPPLERICRHWDLAFSDDVAADYVAGAKMGIDARGHVYILHIRRIHGRWPQSKPIIMELALSDGIEVECIIEANGTQLGYYDDVRTDKLMAGRMVLPNKPKGTKEMRASVWGSRLCDGVIHCVRAPWNQEFFDEANFFPNAGNDDMVDAVSGGWTRLTGSNFWSSLT